MICPLMSKVITEPKKDEQGNPTPGIISYLFQVECIYHNCSLWSCNWGKCSITANSEKIN